MNRLSTEKRTTILAALCEGVSINATSRMTGVSKVTILKLLRDIGPVCLNYQRKTLVVEALGSLVKRGKIRRSEDKKYYPATEVPAG